MTLQSMDLTISAIRNGTVIDHITCGQALRIIRLLNLDQHSKKISIGLNLPGSNSILKDLIKIEDRELSEDEANQIAILSPQTTINIIKNFEVSHKFQVIIPDTIARVIVCPNKQCISNHQPVSTFFYVNQRPHSVQLRCKYCEQIFSQEEVKSHNP